MPIAIYALSAGAFAIGVGEFVVVGLLLPIGADLGVSISAAGHILSGYALGVVIGAPLISIATRTWSRKTILCALMMIFLLGNAVCALASGYWSLMAGRVLTSLAHGPFFGVGSVTAANLAAPNKRASAIAAMFLGLTLANVLGVPSAAWLGHAVGWRAAFAAVALVGVVALAVIVCLLPRDEPAPNRHRLRAELAVFGRRPVLVALLITVLGWGGMFTVLGYMAPLLTQIAGFSKTAIPPVLFVFGVGLVFGNLIGGRLADRRLFPTLAGALMTLSAVLMAMSFALHDRTAVVVFVGLLGTAAFAIVPPLQTWVLEKAGGAGESLVSSVNIAAFNLGNAMAAWIGSVVIARSPGLSALTWVGGTMTVSAVLVLFLHRSRE